MIKANQLGSYVNLAYRMMKRIYIEQGYFASGCIGVEEIYTIHSDKEKVEIIIDGLLESGKVQIRKEYHTLAFELTSEERLELIKTHNLLESWSETGSLFAINENHGEIFTVIKEVKKKNNEDFIKVS